MNSGPLKETISDFWAMVWEQSVSEIVMLANEMEFGRVKVERYWPSAGETAIYGEYAVSTVCESVFCEYCIREISLKRAVGAECRTIYQFHYTAWPDFGVPSSPTFLLEMIGKMSNFALIVVHCSAGVGRTGAFCAIYTALNSRENLDLFSIVK